MVCKVGGDGRDTTHAEGMCLEACARGGYVCGYN